MVKDKTMQKLNKGLLIGGVFASEAIDKSGEVIDIHGLDISNLNNGDAYLNAEHKSDNFSNYLGRIVTAKKIFTLEECISDHEKACFTQAGKVPIVYGTAELFDDEGHREAAAAASIIKHFKKRNLPIAARFSIEGNTLDRDNVNIKQAVARCVALTMMPCNDTCVSDIVKNLTKSEKEVYDKLSAEENKNYLCKGLSGSLEVLDKGNNEPSALQTKIIDLEKKICDYKQNIKKNLDGIKKSEEKVVVEAKINKEDVKRRLAKAELFSYHVLLNS